MLINTYFTPTDEFSLKLNCIFSDRILKNTIIIFRCNISSLQEEMLLLPESCSLQPVYSGIQELLQWSWQPFFPEFNCLSLGLYPAIAMKINPNLSPSVFLLTRIRKHNILSAKSIGCLWHLRLLWFDLKILRKSSKLIHTAEPIVAYSSFPWRATAWPISCPITTATPASFFVTGIIPCKTTFLQAYTTRWVRHFAPG